MHTDYHPAEIELSAQADWEKCSAFTVKENSTLEKFYCLSMLPYPSGELHIGHTRNYTIGDVIARYQRMQKKNVLQPMGWDAFGLPAENAALNRHLAPSVWTHKNITTMRDQMKQLGLAIDWSRELTTCQVDYYRWEQWLFIQLFKKGLAYKKKALVNWDPVDQTVLANEQVVDGKGWRSGAPVQRREITQWFLKITAYAEELLQGLNTLTQWPQQVTHMQHNWIGKSEGLEIQFSVDNSAPLTIFTTRPDTLFGVTYLAIAAEHPLAEKAAQNNHVLQQFLMTCRQSSVAEAEIATQEKMGMSIGLFATHPITQRKIPIWVTNFVLMEYGSGAVMAVPAHDERDHDFAKKYHLSQQPVITALNWDFENAAYTEYGTLMHSGNFDGLSGNQAISAIADFLIEKKLAKKCTHYRLRDWGISRQRYWGTPIPIIQCEKCGDMPVDEMDLPVILPDDLIPTGKGSPLADCMEFYKTTCPRCKKPAKRETDTMDTFMESSWYYARYCSYNQHQAMLDQRANYWLPVDQYVGGIEHAVMHLLYARFIHKVLRDLQLLQSDEPFKKLLTQGMVLNNGMKMSKSKGNVVAPERLIEKYGADTVRLFMIFAAPPEQSLEWSDAGIAGAFRFLKKLWRFAASLYSFFSSLDSRVFSEDIAFTDSALQAAWCGVQQILQQANQDIERQQFNTVVSAAMKILNLSQTITVQSKESIQFLYHALSILLRLLSPIVPHITHRLWQDLQYGKNIVDAPWPHENMALLQSNHYEMMIQINGKLRAKILVSPEQDEASLKAQALSIETISALIQKKKIQRIIVVPKRLMNIVVSS